MWAVLFSLPGLKATSLDACLGSTSGRQRDCSAERRRVFEVGHKQLLQCRAVRVRCNAPDWVTFQQQQQQHSRMYGRGRIGPAAFQISLCACALKAILAHQDLYFLR